jgi:thiamine-phosphate pyrophosphorylase
VWSHERRESLRRVPVVRTFTRELVLPRLYAILDAGYVPTSDAQLRVARELAVAGVTLIQYRNKIGSPREILDQAQALRQGLPGEITLILNDRADLCVAAGFNGVHVGQDDLSPAAARQIVGPDLYLGVSTHNPEQVREADGPDADYIAIGPIFATRSKANPGPLVGLDGIRRARELTRKPLAAIGGITRENCRLAIDAGADSVAVISDLLGGANGSPRGAAEHFLRLFASA